MKQFKIEKTTEELIKDFMQEQKNKRINERDFDIDFYYLNFDNDTFNFTHIYFILLNEVKCGFCFICSFQPSILNRIYINPEYRRKGLATYAIEHLGVRELSCYTDNIPGLNLYRKMGFNEYRKNGIFSISMKR